MTGQRPKILMPPDMTSAVLVNRVDVFQARGVFRVDCIQSKPRPDSARDAVLVARLAFAAPDFADVAENLSTIWDQHVQKTIPWVEREHD